MLRQTRTPSKAVLTIDLDQDTAAATAAQGVISLERDILPDLVSKVCCFLLSLPRIFLLP